MYYIFKYKIYIHKYFKEKIKFENRGTTPTTSLKPAPGAGNVLYPCHFYMVTTGLQQVTTFRFFLHLILYFTDLQRLVFCCMLYPCFRSLKM
jgi:hypothetical protein